MEDKEKDLQEFDLEDIIKEFKEPAEEMPVTQPREQEPAGVTEDTVRVDLPKEQQEEAKPQVTGDTIRIAVPDEVREETPKCVTGDTIRLDPIPEENTQPVTGDTI